MIQLQLLTSSDQYAAVWHYWWFPVVSMDLSLVLVSLLSLQALDADY